MAVHRVKSKKKKTPYLQASDDERVVRNWRKALGLFDRGEYSVAIIRCGTCLELAVNFAIRQELVIERDLPLKFVDSLLKSANGLQNKYQKIFLPIIAESEECDVIKKLWGTHIAAINKERNAIVHSGEFRTRSISKKIMTDTHLALTEIMALYEPSNELAPFEA